jgi:hypothetical protein
MVMAIRHLKGFIVQVIDDAPKTEIVITMDEDHSYGPFTTSADST